MKRTLYILLFILAATLTITAQPANDDVNQCTNETVQRLNVRGFHLGMSLRDVVDAFDLKPEEAQKLIKDNEEFASKNFGWNLLAFDLKYLKDKSKIENVENAYFSFVDGRLYSFSITYKGPIWNDVNLFITKLSDAFRLPKAQLWISEGDGKQIKCGDYYLSAYIQNRDAVFKFYNEKVVKLPQQRSREFEEKKRQAFKP